MIVRATQRLKGKVQSIRRRLAPGALILHYHRVTDLPGDPFLLNVTPRRFAEHLQVMGAFGRFWPLTKLVAALQHGQLPRYALVVTFDDGYADNLFTAKPLLARHAVPATVFVTTGVTQSGREFWWDELERLLLKPGEFPDRLRLETNGATKEWDLGESAVYTGEEWQRNRGWTMAEKRNPSPRHLVFRWLYEQLYTLPIANKRQVLDELAALSGTKAMVRPNHRAMSESELRDLVKDGLVEIGAHTVTHTPLPSLSLTEQRNEIEESKRYLEKTLSCDVKSFAYPHGLFAPETADIVRQAGIPCACTTQPGPVRHSSNPWQLPRMLVMDWTADQLAERLEHWFVE